MVDKMQFDLYYRNIIAELFSVVAEPKTFLNLLQLNELFYSIGKEYIKVKRKEFSVHVVETIFMIPSGNYYFVDFYLLPNGKKDGVELSWYEEGILMTEGTYINGKREGIHREWYDDGKLNKECYYVQDKKEGLYQSWWNNGQLCTQFTIHNGEKVDYQRWDRSGRLLRM